MPDNAAGGAAGGASAWMSGVLKEMQTGITGQEESDNPLGDNNMIDGIGMALEKELLDAAVRGGADIGLHVGAYHPTPPEGAKSRFFLLSPSIEGPRTLEAVFAMPEPDTGFEHRDWMRSCIAAACGGDPAAFDEAYSELIRVTPLLGEQAGTWAGSSNAYVVRFDGSKHPWDLEIQGRKLRLEFAEIWFVNKHPENRFVGPAYETLVPGRRTLRYLDGVNRVVIDTKSEGFNTDSPALEPRVISQEIDHFSQELDKYGEIKAEKSKRRLKQTAKRFLSRFKSNEGPPTQAEIARLVAEASQDDVLMAPFSDPLLKVPSGDKTVKPPPAEPPAPPPNPRTGPTPLLRTPPPQ